MVAPLLSRFTEIYPEISVDLLLDDKPANFSGEQIDVAFREGRIQDSSISAKQLVPMQLLLCASRTYSEKRALPTTIDELRQHESINLRLSNHRLSEWEFKVDGQTQKFMPNSATPMTPNWY
ncbi:hypothetical protein BZM27_54465 [Paraburkholderia steynii]|uniref:LysR substrate-binding domain-containing protein n=1 Tax=Paraburkholderia steynii TaxID=1245441 RepID=A0A4R0X261_9BURK|nr:hypothetical protein BZM27_54465 [Paraburkholderia steynii]